MKRYGLIGKSLKHSFSPNYFKEKFKKENILDANYEAFELKQLDELIPILKSGVVGLNVTMPYKEQIIPYLDELDPVAKDLGSVNTLNLENGKWKGYNTDVIGFKIDLENFISGAQVKNALVLGDGGSAKSVKFVLSDLKISYLCVSRSKGDIQYSSLSDRSISKHDLIINTTPLGMQHLVNEMPPINLNGIKSHHYLYDLIYNPQKTLFLKNGEAQGAKVRNGLGMLYRQAEESWLIWNKK